MYTSSQFASCISSRFHPQTPASLVPYPFQITHSNSHSQQPRPKKINFSPSKFNFFTCTETTLPIYENPPFLCSLLLFLTIFSFLLFLSFFLSFLAQSRNKPLDLERHFVQLNNHHASASDHQGVHSNPH